MGRMWRVVAMGVVTLGFGVARGDSDHLRGLLYRVDVHAYTLRLHPEQATGEAKALQRQAADAADALRREGRSNQAAALRQEGQAVADAAQRNEPEDVRSHAIVMQQLVRELDESLPAPEIAP